VVNAILDAAFLSAQSKKWEPVLLDDWRGHEATATDKASNSYNEQYDLVKKEILPNGVTKLILKDKKSGVIIQKEIPANS
jgi:hypothetical protein